MFKHFLLHLFIINQQYLKMDNEPNMDQEKTLDPNAQQELSPEDYKKARENAIKHLKGEITFLKVEDEYQRLLADIEESKTRRITMIMQRARFYDKQEQPAPNENPDMVAPVDTPPSDEVNKGPRKLKKD